MAEVEKYFTKSGFTYFWGKLKALLNGKVSVEAGKGLSTNDYTTAEKNKLNTIAEYAQANIIEGVKVNNSDLPISEKKVNIDLSAYALKTDITAVLRYKGTKATTAELPANSNVVGDVWFVTENSSEYAWDGSKWEVLGGSQDLSSYLTKAEATSTYLSQTNATNLYLTKTDAGSIYLKITDASGTYVTTSGLEASLEELLTTIGETYLSKSSADSTYAKKTDVTAITNSEIDAILAG